MIDFSNLPVGTKVWAVGHGWGEITENDHSARYPIDVKFLSLHEVSYTIKGKRWLSDVHPSLFLNEFEIPEQAYKPPRPDLKVDDKVIVWDGYRGNELNRHFKRWGGDGRIVCFGDGLTSWSDDGSETSWGNYELVKKAGE